MFAKKKRNKIVLKIELDERFLNRLDEYIEKRVVPLTEKYPYMEIQLEVKSYTPETAYITNYEHDIDEVAEKIVGHIDQLQEILNNEDRKGA